ncbi:hypothetical protein D3C72_1572050 [compost metagenome]
MAGSRRVTIELGVGFERGQCPQQGAPLVVTTGRTVTDRLGLFTEHFVASIEQTQGVVGTLDKGAQADKAEGIVAHDGAVGGTTKQVRALLDPFTKAAHPIAAQPLLGDATDLQPGGVDVFPHVGGDPSAHRMGTGPCCAQTTVDARRVVRIEGEKVQQALGMQLAVALQVVVQSAGNQQGHGHFIQTIAATILRHQRQ